MAADLVPRIRAEQGRGGSLDYMSPADAFLRILRGLPQVGWLGKRGKARRAGRSKQGKRTGLFFFQLPRLQCCAAEASHRA